MEITFILSSLWLSGGVQVVLEYANRLCERGNKVTFVTPANTIDNEMARMVSPSITIREAGFSPDRKMGLVKKASLAFELARIVPSCDVIIATHTPTTMVSMLARKLFHRRGLPVWFYMDYPGMFVNLTLESWLLRNAMRWHKAAFVLSKYSTQELSQFTHKEIIPVGLGLSNYELLKPVDTTSLERREKKAIMYLGDFRPRKGFLDFLQAAEIVFDERKDVELWIAMKEKGEIKTNLPFKHFFRPSVPQLSNLYATCDLFVSASWYEGFGLPPLEAMACGAPVVLTNSGGVQDFAVSGENCLVVPTRQPMALAQAILTVLNDQALENKFRKAGPATAARFTWDAAVDRFERAVVKLLD